jgi:hypothetical protein
MNSRKLRQSLYLCILGYVDRHGGADESRPFGKGWPISPEARERSFDALATGLASGSISRGRALKLMGAALVGSTLASLGIGEAAADPTGCKRNGKHCTKDRLCCSRNCVNGTCAACPSGRVLLSNGTCALPCSSACPVCSSTGLPSCTAEATTGVAYCRGDVGGRCTTTNDCPTGQFCSQGTCSEAC